MSRTPETRLAAALAGSPLAGRLARSAAPLLEGSRAEALAALPSSALTAGVARAVATSAEAARFLATRPRLLERLPGLAADYLDQRGAELEVRPRLDATDLEAFLDGLRLLRREETLLAACLDLAGLVPVEDVSRFLSLVAEAVVRDALAAARASAGPGAADVPVTVVSMGKLGGREFTYHSDLDLIFLFQGGTEGISDASRVCQRLIAYLSTMTAAGVAYAVDARLRPSGQQGTLVTSFESFARYQAEEAQTWEHMALVRARPIAGRRQPASQLLDHVRQRMLTGSRASWGYVREMRERVERERASDAGPIHFKTGAGGILDVEFLAEGAVLERGCAIEWPPEPSIPALLSRAASGSRVRELIAGYQFLRRVEARARWVSGRAAESLPRKGEDLEAVAELVEPGLSAAGLVERLEETLQRIRRLFRAVVEADSIRALEA